MNNQPFRTVDLDGELTFATIEIGEPEPVGEKIPPRSSRKTENREEVSTCLMNF